MAISRTDILEFIPRMEVGRENLVDELLYESMAQREKDTREKSYERLDKLTADLAAIQTAIAALREEADRRR